MSLLQVVASVALFELIALTVMLALAVAPEVRRPLSRGERLVGWYCAGLAAVCAGIVVLA